MRRRALIYCRLSQDRTGAGVVVERQERECRELAATLGWDVVGVLVDNDVSAYRKKARPGYQALTAALEAGEGDAVLVWHADRLHRSPKELEAYIDLCEPRGVVTATVRAGDLDLATASGRMVARQLGAVARYESEQIAGRTKAGKADAASRGEWQGGQRMYGYEFVPLAERTPGESALRVVPEEAEVVRDASRRVLAGESLRSIAMSLNARGNATAKGRPWTGSALRKVLLRPSGAGLRAKGGEVLGPGKWEPLISEEEWRGVVAILTNPSRRTNVGATRTYLGSGLYVCGVCGGKLGGNTTAGGGPGNRKAAYRCRTTDRDGKVHVVRAVEPLDAFVGDLVKARLSEPDAHVTRRPAAEDTVPLQVEAAALRARMEALATQWTELEMTQVQFVAANREFRRKLDELDRRIAAAQQTSVLDGLTNIGQAWETMNLDRRRAVVDLLMEVTVLPRSRTGRVPGGSYWDPATISIQWKAA